MSKKNDSIPIFLILFLLIVIILFKYLKIIAIILGVILGAILIGFIGNLIYKKRQGLADFFTHSYKRISHLAGKYVGKIITKHSNLQNKIVAKHSSLLRELETLNESFYFNNDAPLCLYYTVSSKSSLDHNDKLQLVYLYCDEIVNFLLATKKSKDDYQEYLSKYNKLLDSACTKENFKKMHLTMKYDTFKEVELRLYNKSKLVYQYDDTIKIIFNGATENENSLTIPCSEFIEAIKEVFVKSTSSLLRELETLNEKYKQYLSGSIYHFDLRKYHIQDNNGKITNTLVKKAISDMISQKLSYYSNIKMRIFSNHSEYTNYHKQCAELFSTNRDVGDLPFLDGMTLEEFLSLEATFLNSIIITQNPKEITLTIQHPSLGDKNTIIKDINLLQLITEQEHLEFVKKTSKPYLYALELNHSYHFYEIEDYTKRISMTSLSTFNNFNKEKYLKKNFSSFYDELSIILSKISSNRELYSEYKFKYSNIPQSKYDEISSYLKSINDLRASDFIKYEKQLIKELELFPKIDFSLNFVVGYVTPKRSNFYEKVETCSYDLVNEILNIAKLENEEKTKKSISKQQIEKKYNYIIAHEKELEQKEIAFKEATKGHIYTTAPSQNTFTPKLEDKESNSAWAKLKNLKIQYDSGDVTFEQYEKERYNILMQEE